MRRIAIALVVLATIVSCGPQTPQEEAAAILNGWADCLEDRRDEWIGAFEVVDGNPGEVCEDSDLPPPSEVSPEVREVLASVMPDADRLDSTLVRTALREGYGAAADSFTETIRRTAARAEAFVFEEQ